jgi:hypothetical protein
LASVCSDAARDCHDNLVTRELRAALNEVFADFDPLSPENSDGANVQALGDDVAEKLRAKVGEQIETST